MLPRKLGRPSIVIGILLLIAIGGGLWIWQSRHSKLQPAAMTAYMPAREAAVLYMDLETIRVSGLLERIIGSTGEEAEYQSFVQGTGFDYKRDLDRVLMSSNGGVHYFLLQGRFDWDKLESYAKSQGGSCSGRYCSMKGSVPERIISFRALRNDLMALASARDESAARAIEKRSNDKPPFDIPQKPVWLHMPASMLSVTPTVPGTRLFLKALEPAERILLTLGPADQKFELTLDVTCRTQEEAAILKAHLEGITTLLQKLISREKQTPNKSDLSGVLTAGSFTRTDRLVTGRWPIERSFLESLGGS